jgi:hypothetical protein
LQKYCRAVEMIRYIPHNHLDTEQCTVDEYANLRHLSGDYIIVLPDSEEKPQHKPTSLTKVGNEWVEIQMEFDFG